MEDAIIVLAGGINKDGTLPVLPKSRVDEGVRRYKDGESSRILMSGKYGFWLDWSKEVPVRSEASAMKEYAETLGVRSDDILIEDESKDTLGNAYFTKIHILEPQNYRNVIVVTSDFHIDRTRYIFDLVLGPEYTVKYIGVPTHFSVEKIAILQDQEVRTIQVLKEIIGDKIIPGDTRSVEQILFSKHPGYCTNPEYTYEKLREMLGRK